MICCYVVVYHIVWYQAILDPEFFYRDDYLKYLGWLCCDPAGPVRRQAVRAVVRVLNAKSEAEPITNFVEVSRRITNKQKNKQAVYMCVLCCIRYTSDLFLIPHQLSHSLTHPLV